MLLLLIVISFEKERSYPLSQKLIHMNALDGMRVSGCVALFLPVVKTFLMQGQSNLFARDFDPAIMTAKLERGKRAKG